MPPWLTAARSFPSGEKFNDLISSGTPGWLLVNGLRIAASRRSATFQSLTEWSPLPLANVLPSGENAKAQTGRLCPFNVASHLPVLRFQSLMVLSVLPEAAIVLSGQTARLT